MRCCANTKGARISVSGGTDISGASTGGWGGGGGGGGDGQGGGGGGGGFNRLQILIQGPDIEQLQTYTTQLMDKVRTIPGVVDVDSNFEPTQPELHITVDRARAADLGVNIDSLATTCARWSAAKKSPSSRTATISSSSGSASTSRTATIRRRWATS